MQASPKRKEVKKDKESNIIPKLLPRKKRKNTLPLTNDKEPPFSFF